MHSSTLFFFLGIAAGTLGAITLFSFMLLTAWAMVDFVTMS